MTFMRHNLSASLSHSVGSSGVRKMLIIIIGCPSEHGFYIDMFYCLDLVNVLII